MQMVKIQRAREGAIHLPVTGDQSQKAPVPHPEASTPLSPDFENAFGMMLKTELRAAKMLAHSRYFCAKVLCFLVVKVKPYNWFQRGSKKKWQSTMVFNGTW